MPKLFGCLVEENLIVQWAGILDWLFDEQRFSEEKGWSSGYVGAFAKKVKKLPYFGEKTYQYTAQKNLTIPKPKEARAFICFIHANGNGEAKDIVRHIRNGIAHGKAQLYRNGGMLYIEICDYSAAQKQTAYINMPLHYIHEIHAIYQNINSAINHEKKHKRRKKPAA